MSSDPLGRECNWSGQFDPGKFLRDKDDKLLLFLQASSIP